MKIAFFWTWDFSQSILSDIITKHPDIFVCLAVSQPDKPIGRKKIISPTAVKSEALKHNIPVLQPEKLKWNNDFFQALRDKNLDFIVVVAYGKIVPTEVLEAAKHGCINIHGSILPKYRWASPIQEAIKNGDSQTGLTIMYMSEGMDEGDILDIQTINILKDDNSLDIFQKFQEFGAHLLIQTLNKIISKDIIALKQDDRQATYCQKIQKTDGLIDWNNSAEHIYNTFKAYTPWPGIYSYYNGKKFSIEKCKPVADDNYRDCDFPIGAVVEYEDKENTCICVLTETGMLEIEQIKLEWKQSMDIFSFINGNKNFLDYNFNTKNV